MIRGVRPSQEWGGGRREGGGWGGSPSSLFSLPKLFSTFGFLKRFLFPCSLRYIVFVSLSPQFKLAMLPCSISSWEDLKSESAPSRIRVCAVCTPGFSTMRTDYSPENTLMFSVRYLTLFTIRRIHYKHGLHRQPTEQSPQRPIHTTMFSANSQKHATEQPKSINDNIIEISSATYKVCKEPILNTFEVRLDHLP